MHGVDIPLMRVGAAPPIGRPDTPLCVFQQIRVGAVLLVFVASSWLAAAVISRPQPATTPPATGLTQG